MNARVQVRSREPRLDTGLIDTARAIVQDAPTLDAALLGLGKTVAPRLDVWRISVRMVDLQAQEMVFVGVWSRAGTVLDVGTRIPIFQTALPEILRTHRPVLFDGVEEHPALLHQILASEGMRSWVTIPLYEVRTIVGALALSSIDLGAFTREDVPFYIAFGEGIEDRLLELVRWVGEVRGARVQLSMKSLAVRDPDTPTMLEELPALSGRSNRPSKITDICFASSCRGRD